MITSMHVIGSRYSGGAEMFFIRLVNALYGKGYPVSTITRPGSMVSAELASGIEQTHVGMYNVRDPFSRARISRIIREKKPDVIQTYMGRATRLSKVPRGRHTIHVSRLGGFYKLDGYSHAHAWVGNTRSICDYLIENSFPADRVFLIPNFVETGPPADPESLRRAKALLGIPVEVFLILGVGRMLEKKGFRYLIEAFRRFPESFQGKPAHLLIVGSGPEEGKLQSLASQLKIDERVHWAGWQTDPGPYYEMADVFVCPSLHEPLGNVILEAWSHGLPVVSTTTHGALELIDEGVNGLLVPCGDSSAIADKVRDLFFRDKTAENMAREGRAVLGEKYSKDAIVSSYMDLYSHLLTVGK